jgi:hypothetical protein
VVQSSRAIRGMNGAASAKWAAHEPLCCRNSRRLYVIRAEGGAWSTGTGRGTPGVATILRDSAESGNCEDADSLHRPLPYRSLRGRLSAHELPR